MGGEGSAADAVNQSPPFEDVNLYLSDPGLRAAVRREGASWADEELAAFGAEIGSAQSFARGRLANTHLPELRRGDGGAADIVDYHPAYHELMGTSFAAGLHCSPWEHLAGPGGRPRAGAHVARAARLYMTPQAEAGHVCPLTMTHAAIPALLAQPDIGERLLPKFLSREYDPSHRAHAEKASITIGMGMTEKQGGTDVRANTTRAEPSGALRPGREYVLDGHKWFLSAPMCDAFLILAQADGGLSCFFVPRLREDGAPNGLRLEKLKDKLGNRSNASVEVAIEGARGRLIGEEGRGIAAIMPMVTLTRLDCAVASAGQMRLALALATHHCRHRTVFQKRLIDQPIMAGVLADMALDVEAATALAFRLARANDAPPDDAAEAAWRRLMTPVTKYWVCKIAPALGYEAMECIGGNGYVEDGPAARLYRELPLNAIWEGSGNVMCLDVLRVLSRDENAPRLVFAALDEAAREDARIADALSRLRGLLADPAALERHARRFVELLALTAAGVLLRTHAANDVADAFIASRLSDGWRQTYGVGAEAALNK